jgi:hypothetical protein
MILLGINFPSLKNGASFLPKFAFQYFFSFSALYFFVCSSLKKQMKSNLFRRRAFELSVIICAAIIVLIEITAMYIYPNRSFQWFWSFSGLIGVVIGIGSFRLLYDACC